MLFHITQVHAPELCPRDEGGSNSLYDDTVPGVTLLGRYGANDQHTFLWPGFTRCTSSFTPVSEVPVSKG